jgi:hypothetical protein
MPELGSYGSVRGAAGNSRPLNDGPGGGGIVRSGPSSESLHKTSRQNMSAAAAAFIESGHRSPIPKIM